MLTIFTAAQPFCGRTAAIQRNALQSWNQLHRDVQIILFGDATGSQEIAWELGIHYEEHAQPTSSGAVPLDYALAATRRLARYGTLCYVACDVILLPDFCEALNRVEGLYGEFVMTGCSRDVRLSERFPFEDLEWEIQFPSSDASEKRLSENGRMAYAAFSKNLYMNDVPAIPTNQPAAVEWLLGSAEAQEVAVVDASAMVLAFRQLSDCGEAASGEAGAGQPRWGLADQGTPLARRRSSRCAPLRLTASDVVRNRWRRVRNLTRTGDR